MRLYFLTHNKYKYEEVKELLTPCKNVKLELVEKEIEEIQSNDMKVIARDKVLKAFNEIRNPIIVEHTGLFLKDYENVPGGLTQFFWDSLKVDKFCELFAKNKSAEAVAKSVIAYCDGKVVKIFEGETKGNVIEKPKGPDHFQWDCIFQPEGCTESYAQLGKKKNNISMRKLAIDKLTEYLEKNA